MESKGAFNQSSGEELRQAEGGPQKFKFEEIHKKKMYNVVACLQQLERRPAPSLQL